LAQALVFLIVLLEPGFLDEGEGTASQTLGGAILVNSPVVFGHV
jgi:hypothetical protein